MTSISPDSEKIARGQQVITACAFIHQKFNGVEKVFLPKRAATKKFLPNVFELPGGHIDYGEDVISGLKREIKEEVRMTINVGDPFYVFTYMNEVKGSHSLEVVYFASFIEPIDNIHLNPEDHSEYQWVERSEILKKVVNANKQEEDEEIKAIMKGFALLDNASLNIG